ncbi:hypothetical protein V6Z12_A05G240800 [Gossypium hirsutum]
MRVCYFTILLYSQPSLAISSLFFPYFSTSLPFFSNNLLFHLSKASKPFPCFLLNKGVPRITIWWRLASIG